MKTKLSIKINMVMVMLFLMPVLATAALTDNLDFYFDFNGDSDDSTANNYDGTEVGTVVAGDTYILTASRNLGTNTPAGHIDLDSSSSRLSGAFTVCTWINMTGAGYDNYIYQDWGGGSFNILFYLPASSGHFRVYSGNGGSLDAACNSVATINANTFYHVCAARNSTTVRLYVDGSIDKTCIGSYSGVSTGNTRRIGEDSGGSANNMASSLDEYGVWTRHLTDAEITGLYNSGSGLAYPFIAPNTAPDNPTSVIIYSLDGSNNPNSDLNCSGILGDSDGDNMNMTVDWFKDGVKTVTEVLNNNYADGSNFTATLNKANLTTGDYWNCSLQATDGQETSSFVNSSSVEIISANNAPNNPTDVIIYSLDGSNTTKSNLNCSGIITDNDGDLMNVTVDWFMNSTKLFSEDLNNNYGNTTVTATLNKNNLSITDVWNCSIQSTDGEDYSSFVNSSNIEIIPSPFKVNVVSPINLSTLQDININVSFNFNFNTEVCYFYSNYTGTSTLISNVSSFTQYIPSVAYLDFSKGVYTNTNYDGIKIKLNSSATSGNYTSQIFNGTMGSNWTSIIFDYYLPSFGKDYAHYTLNESAGTNASDISGNNRHGTLTNMEDVDWVAGKMGNALSFDGSNEYVDLGNIADFDRYDPFSVSVWIKTSTASKMIMARHSGTRGWFLFLSSTGQVFWALTNAYGTNQLSQKSINSVTDDGWHHIVVTYNGNGENVSGLEVYVDNVDEEGATTETLTDTFSVGVNARIAAWNSGLYFNGLIDDARIFNSTLSSSEVTTLYNGGNGLQSNLGSIKLGMNISVQSCDDTLCDGESFTLLNLVSPQYLDLDINPYFRYMINFTSSETGYSGEFNDADVNYTKHYNPAPLVVGDNYTLNETYPVDTDTFLEYIIQCFDGSTGINGSTTFYYNNTDQYNPVVNVTHINKENFYNQMQIEAQNIVINVSCVGDTVVFMDLNVSYSNGTLIRNVRNSTGYVNFTYFSSLDLPMDDNYTISLYCKDDDGQSNYFSGIFEFLDTTKPTAVWLNPSSNNLTVHQTGTYMDLDLTVSDENLFSLLVECFDNLSVKKHSFYAENITSPYQYNGFTSNMTNTGFGKCNISVRDRHTMKSIKGLPIIIDKSQDKQSVLFDYKSSSLNISVSGITPNNFVVQEEGDRFSFFPEMEELPNSLTYYVSCDTDQLYFWDDGVYDGVHTFGKYFGCGEFWIDFNIEGVPQKNYKVNVLSDNKARIDIVIPKSFDDPSQLKTNSIGIKNTLNEAVLFEVGDTPTAFSFTLQQSVIYGIIILIWLALMFMGLFFSIPIFLTVAGLLGIFASFLMFLNVSVPIMIILVVFNSIIGLIPFIGKGD